MDLTKFPKCDICSRPMALGQIRRHYACTPGTGAYLARLKASTERNIEPIPEPFEVGMERSQDAAEAGWSKNQIERVDQAIAHLAFTVDSFTADDVWTELGPGFPVTKGLAARLVHAQRRGLIASTDRTRKSTRGGTHDHGQRLTVWITTTKEGLFE